MEKRISILEHLEELRKRIILILVFFIIALVLSLIFAPQILKVLKFPLRNFTQRLVYFSPIEPVSIYIRIAVLVAVAISFPFILYQIWLYILPALEERFKRYTFIFILLSFLLFSLGALFAYFVVLPLGLRFLLSLGGEILQPLLSASNYISFVGGIIFFCGLAFQLPIWLVILAKMGFINSLFLRRNRKWLLIFIFILSALITPTTDIFNMLLVALPLIILYQISIWLVCLIR